MRIAARTSSVTSLKLSTNPSSLRMVTIATFIREEGTSTVLCLATCALRMRVRRSAIGSVMFISSLLPTRLGDARKRAFQREVPEADPAELELPEKPSRPPAPPAAAARADRELRFPNRLGDPCRCGHVHILPCQFLRNGMPSPARSARASSSVLAVVTMHTFMPLTFCTLAYDTSGKISWSRTPSV